MPQKCMLNDKKYYWIKDFVNDKYWNPVEDSFYQLMLELSQHSPESGFPMNSLLQFLGVNSDMLLGDI